MVASHSRAALSAQPVKTILPSGLKAAAKTAPSFVSRGPRGRAAATSQSRAVVSLLPVATVLPSGLNATLVTCPRWRSGGPIERAGRGVPESARGVVAASGDGLAVADYRPPRRPGHHAASGWPIS